MVKVAASGMSSRGRARKADDAAGGGRHQRTIQLKAGTKAPQEKIDGDHHQRGIHRGRKTRSPVADAENAVGQHGLPVVERRLLEPGLAAQRGRDPVVTGEHLARHLRVTRLVGSEQAEVCQAEEKQEAAEAGEQQPIHERPLPRNSTRRYSMSSWRALRSHNSEI